MYRTVLLNYISSLINTVTCTLKQEKIFKVIHNQKNNFWTLPNCGKLCKFAKYE